MFERLQIALATGDVINLRRGELHADRNSLIQLPFPRTIIEAKLPSYQMPRVSQSMLQAITSNRGMDVTRSLHRQRRDARSDRRGELKLLAKH